MYVVYFFLVDAECKINFKTEVLEVHERPVFADLADAQRSVADYFDYYNHKRLHARIDYQTPYQTHQQLLQFSALNCPA